MILKTEQTTILYAQWDRWPSNDVIYDHESSGFRKLAVNKWTCRKNCDFFLD